MATTQQNISLLFFFKLLINKHPTNSIAPLLPKPSTGSGLLPEIVERAKNKEAPVCAGFPQKGRLLAVNNQALAQDPAHLPLHPQRLPRLPHPNIHKHESSLRTFITSLIIKGTWIRRHSAASLRVAGVKEAVQGRPGGGNCRKEQVQQEGGSGKRGGGVCRQETTPEAADTSGTGATLSS